MPADYNKEAIELHKKHHGKIEIGIKVPLESREDLSRAYTPGVAEICREIARDPALGREYTMKHNMVAIITDGSAVLGLGNLGPLAALPVMEGKAAIFKKFGGVDCFPICLDTQDTEEIIKTIKLIAPVFGAINLEDISAPRCFEIEERLRKELTIPVMHDDQWGAATVCVAALINALRVRGLTPTNARIVISGVGASGVATGRLLLSYGAKNLIFCDSQGIVHPGRRDLTKEKIELLNGSAIKPEAGYLADAVKAANVFIGLSRALTLTGAMIKTMADRPIVFGMANPTPEIMPEEAKAAGAFIVATGRSDYPNQINNSLCFPGAFRGMLDLGGQRQFSNDVFLKIAQALADSLQKPTVDKIIPSMFDSGVAELVTRTIKG